MPPRTEGVQLYLLQSGRKTELRGFDGGEDFDVVSEKGDKGGGQLHMSLNKHINEKRS
jgi:hypothetical protein